MAEFAEHLLLRRSYKELAEFSEKNLRAATDTREMQVLIMMRVIADIYLNKSFQDAIAQTSIIWHHFPIDYNKSMPIDTEVGLFISSFEKSWTGIYVDFTWTAGVKKHGTQRNHVDTEWRETDTMA